MIKSDMQLDAKGLACPMPIVKTKKAMNDVIEGQVLEIQATDKGSVADLEAWSKSTGHHYIGSFEKNGVFYHYIRKCNMEMNELSYSETINNEEVSDGIGVILDVREAAEYAFGHIPGAISIPMGELTSRIDELNKEQMIYVICRTGTRSALAAKQLSDAGFINVKNVLPGMNNYNGLLQANIS